MEIAKEYQIENTLIKIADDFCRDKSEAEVTAILARVAERALEQLAVDGHTKNTLRHCHPRHCGSSPQ